MSHYDESFAHVHRGPRSLMSEEDFRPSPLRVHLARADMGRMACGRRVGAYTFTPEKVTCADCLRQIKR